MPILALIAAAKSSSSSLFLPILLVIFAGVYFFVLRPRQQAARKQRETASAVEVGDHVQTIGGIRGHVIAMSDDGDEVTIATGHEPGSEPNPNAPTHMTFTRRAVQKLPDSPSEESGAAESGEDGDEGSASS